MTGSGMKWASVALLLYGCVMCATAAAQEPQAKNAEYRFIVGVFDSRAVAIAYARSDVFKRDIKSVTEEFEKAKSAGDQKRMAEINTQMEERQALMHKQGFSTYSVSDILDKIKDRLPEIARQANVDTIVSKWDVVYQRSGIEFIDITDLMVKPFSPNEQTLTILKEMAKQKPIPLEQMKNFKD